MSLGEIFSRPMIHLYEALGWRVDLILPVPLSKERYQQRGYNQAGLLARPVALALNIPYQPERLNVGVIRHRK